jgi:hypothetical protein
MGMEDQEKIVSAQKYWARFSATDNGAGTSGGSTILDILYKEM